MAQAIATKPVKEATYRWQATDRKGQKMKGQMIGPNEAFIKQQ